ncbi:NlpC/P60 family protein [Henriciella sp.]|uniref:NlpC/P60 family protein n=1 Tax=Henriciella sp. TaxID=1968823 RepID=UPI00261566C9|nr:NlpC/P60 family protein [Henriciella sp.]
MRRADIVAAAESWLGTPYQHQASRKGAGTDCLGLLRGVWREVCGAEPQPVPPYTPDWAEALADDLLMASARQHLNETAPGHAREGDVLLFRMRLGVPAKHCAILVAPERIIHAYWGRSVCMTRLVPWWSRRVAGAFSFPGLED